VARAAVHLTGGPCDRSRIPSGRSGPTTTLRSSGFSDDLGRFVFTDLSAGSYEIRTVHPDGQQVTLRARKAARIRGRVVLADGRAPVEALVVAHLPETLGPYARAPCDREGRFELLVPDDAGTRVRFEASGADADGQTVRGRVSVSASPADGVVIRLSR